MNWRSMVLVAVLVAMGCKGDKGDQGDPGATGPAGPQGPTGPAGPLPIVATDGGLVGDGSAANPVALDLAIAALRAKSIYQVWGRSTCPAGDGLVHTGWAGAMGGSQGAMSGNIMCLDQGLSPTTWVAWSSALVSRARSSTQSAGNRAEYMQIGEVQCAVCKGLSYTLWGRTTCGVNDSVIYVGHIAQFTYNATNGGANAAGPFCMDDGASGLTWTNWSGNSIIARATSASSSPYSQYLEGRDGVCVVCR